MADVEDVNPYEEAADQYTEPLEEYKAPTSAEFLNAALMEALDRDSGADYERDWEGEYRDAVRKDWDNMTDEQRAVYTKDTGEDYGPVPCQRAVAYISGPMRSMPDCNYPYFNQVQKKLEDEGWAVRNPARHFNGDTDHTFAEYMELDYADVLASDTVFLLPGWQDSEGARLEVQVAKSLGKNFQLVDDATETLPVESEAQHLVRNGVRQQNYGDPNQDFSRTALMWSAIFGVDVTAFQVSLAMVALKMSRLTGKNTHRDSLVDAVGYLICAERVLDATKSTD